MRGLSLTQPWASLVAIGAKQWETRSWSTQFRGQVGIHASKSYPRSCRELEYEEPFLSALKKGMASPHMLPTGSIVALATVEDVRPTNQISPIGAGQVLVSPEEYAFGDYYAGRYAFLLTNVMQLRTPIPCRGALGFWRVPDEVIAQITGQLTDMQHDDSGGASYGYTYEHRENETMSHDSYFAELPAYLAQQRRRSA